MLGREIVAASRDRGVELVGWDRDSFDVTDSEAVRRVVTSVCPRAVIHSAAWTDVDGCESDPQRAFLVNGRGTAHLVEACRESGSRLVMVSTDYVFSGDKDGAYVESDAAGPISAYGWSKLVGEEAVCSLGADGVVARTSWLFGDRGRNFLLTMLRLAEERPEISVIDDQIGRPTFVADLASALLDLAVSAASGVFHVTNRGEVSWYGFARKIFEVAAIDVKTIPVTSDTFRRPARRPHNSVLEDTRMTGSGLDALPDWPDALRRCLARMELVGDRTES
jgi:dTDP-4-dehydrorhamnose reductase